MKLKGIKRFEQHIEKIVLIAVAGALLAVIAMQFVVQPNRVELTSGQTIPPQAIYEELKKQADQLDSLIGDTEPVLPEVQTPDIAARYTQVTTRPVSPIDRLAGAFGREMVLDDLVGKGVLADTSGPVSGLRVPVPTGAVASSLWSTLDPYFVADTEGLAEYLPTAQPFDMPSVSIEAAFSGTDLRAALITADEGYAPVPRRFWSTTGVTILDVQVERQQQLASGAWAEPVAITHLPGTERPIETLGESPDYADLIKAVSEVSKKLEPVIRPEFAPIISGMEWLAPSKSANREGNIEKLARIERLRQQIESKQEQITRLRSAASRTTNRTTSPGVSTGSRSGRSGGGGRSSTTRSRTDAGRVRIERLQADVAELTLELTELTAEPEDTNQAQADDADRKDLLNNEAVQVWAHDIGIEPGATYRYRLRVAVNNPLYRQGPKLDRDDPAQQALAESAYSLSDWSDWTEPVHVGGETFFYVTNASEHGFGAGTGSASVSARMFKMYYGHYRSVALTLEPGNPLVGMVRLPETLVTFDTAVLTRQEAVKATADIAAALADDTLELPEGLVPVNQRLEVTIDASLLDVALMPTIQTDSLGRSSRISQAIFRGIDGLLIIRDEKNQNDPGLRLATLSASLGSAGRIEWGGERRRGTSTGRMDPRIQDPRQVFDPSDLQRRDPRGPGRRGP